MLLRWVEGAHYHELSQYAPPGVINRIAENSHWISRGLVNLCQKPLFDFNHDLLNNLIDISDRIYFGVPKEAVAAMKLHVQGVHRRRALNLAASGYVTIEKITDASIDELAKVADIGPAIAARIKEATEKYLNSQVKRMRSSQLRIALKKNKNKELILGLYEKTDDDFSKHIVKILCEEIGLLATYVGDNNPHEPDIIIKTQQGIIAIECKRHKKDTVTAIEAEEILGKGSKYTPIASVTIGYPEFAEVARQSANNSKVTLLTASVFGEMVTQFWLDKLTTDSIITLLKCGKPIYELEPYYLKP
jgi:hypothetical protein